MLYLWQGMLSLIALPWQELVTSLQNAKQHIFHLSKVILEADVILAKQQDNPLT